MNLIGVTLVLLAAQIGLGTLQRSSLDRLQAKLPIEPVADLNTRRLVGKYSDPAKEFAPGLSGNDLYLFPDGDYVYDEWADIEPLTIRDKGHWQLVDGVIVLSSDKDVTWEPGAERRYIAVHRRSRSREILLVGTDRALVDFEANGGTKPEMQLLFVAKQRSASFKGDQDALRTKEKLIHDAWDPVYFQPEKK
jgi:hypothetical protein